ncbi:hypothetical protein BDP27DRAFT_1323665, partial [Rhodocollybia butyracea]
MPDAVLCHTCRKTLSVRDFPVLNDFNRQYLRSLYVPNNVEAARIIRETTEVDLDISELDKEIQGLQSILKELETQRKALEHFRDKARSLLAPLQLRLCWYYELCPRYFNNYREGFDARSFSSMLCLEGDRL